MKLELITTQTADGVELDGALYRPEGGAASGILLVHGLTWNFYRGPCRWLAPVLAEGGYVALSLNMRDHDLTEPVDFDLSHRDIRAGVDFLLASGCSDVVALAHGYACNKAVCYGDLSGDARVTRYVLTTLGSVKGYRPDIWDKVLHAAPKMTGRALVVQGAVDQLIEGEARAGELVAAAENAAVDVVYLEDGDHYFARAQRALANTVLGWLARNETGADRK